MEEVTTAVSTWISGLATSALKLITDNIPVVLGVVAAGIIISLGIAFAKKLKK